MVEWGKPATDAMFGCTRSSLSQCPWATLQQEARSLIVIRRGERTVAAGIQGHPISPFTPHLPPSPSSLPVHLAHSFHTGTKEKGGEAGER